MDMHGLEERFMEAFEGGNFIQEEDDNSENELVLSRTYEEAMVLTRDRGFVLRYQDGSEFQITIVQSKLPHRI